MGMLRAFIDDESGATAIEYAFLAALVALGCVAGMQSLGGAVANRYAGFAALFGS